MKKRDLGTPLAASGDFHPADTNKDGLVSNKERRQYSNSEKNKKKVIKKTSNKTKTKTKSGNGEKIVNTVKNIASAAVGASAAYKTIKNNTK